MRGRRLLSLAMFTLAILLAPLVVWGQGTFTTIDYPSAASTYAYGINPAGNVVGAYIDASGQKHGFVLIDGHFTSIDWPNATWTEAWGINPRGDIVGQYGWSENGVNTIRGFLLQDGKPYPIDIEGQPKTMPVRINPEGTIVGCSHLDISSSVTDMNTMYGFVLDAAGVTSLATNRTMNNGVNPAGDIVGVYYSPTSGRVEQSYLIRDGETTWFNYPGSFATLAWDINPRGTIVGAHRTSLTGTNQFHGFIMEDGEMTSFDVPESTETRAFGISATDDIVGYYRDATGYHGFLYSRRRPR